MADTVQQRLDKLEEIKSLCQILINHDNTPSSQKEWLTGRSDAARMILEIVNRKGTI